MIGALARGDLVVTSDRDGLPRIAEPLADRLPVHRLTAYAEGGSAAGDTMLVELPQLETRLTVVDLHLTRALPGGWEVGLRYWYEEWKSDDWQTDCMRSYVGHPLRDPEAAVSSFLGVDFSDYENHVLMLTARYEL